MGVEAEQSNRLQGIGREYQERERKLRKQGIELKRRGMEMMIRKTFLSSCLLIIATAAATDALYYGKFSRPARSAPFLPNRADRMVRHIVAQNTVEPTRVMNRPRTFMSPLRRAKPIPFQLQETRHPEAVELSTSIEQQGPPPVPALTVGEMLDLLNSMSQEGGRGRQATNKELRFGFF